MTLRSNIFNITKVRNGVDANSRRIETNVETVYKFVQRSEYKVAVGLTEEEFNSNKTKYYYYDSQRKSYIQCTNQSIFNNSETYYIIIGTGENNKIIYSFSPNDLIIGIVDTSTDQPLDIHTGTVEIRLNDYKLQTLIGDYYQNYFVLESDHFHWRFYFEDFYNDLYTGDLVNLSQDTINLLYTFFESQEPTRIDFYIGFESSSLYRAIPLQIGTDLVAAHLFEKADGIYAAIADAGLVFDSNGLAINNGNLSITNSNNDTVFNFNKSDGTLSITGIITATSGIFSGELRAATGTFSGEIIATTGTIGGFNILENSIESVDLILNSTTSNNESSIYVKNITLGVGALIEKYLKIGNFSLLNPQSTTDYINYDNSVAKLIQPHSQITVDPEPINGKNYYTLSGNDYILFTGNNFESGVTYYEDGIYFQLTNEGFINGNNWSIKKESNNDYVTARFGKLIAEDGEFNGIIHARDGVFSGEITSSIISASTINTANFITEKTRSMGGAFIFKPTFEIEDIQNNENEDYTLIFTLSSNAIEYFSLEGNNDKVVAVSGTDVRFGKLNSIDSQNNQVGVTFTETDYTILSASGALDNYQTLTLFGQAENEVLIGINSDNTSTGDILPPRAISMETFTNLQTSQSGVGDIDYSLKLLLGDLTTLRQRLGSSFNYINGYGLYSDNVYLHGSLITEDNAGSYAGVHTSKNLDFNYTNWGGTRTDIYNNEKIIFWGGANSLSDSDIQRSPFIVTDKGSIFARRGEFKGTVIADSIITDTIIKTPVIYGNGNNPSLRIYDTNNSKSGIGFYKLINDIDLESGEDDDILTLNISNIGFTHYYNNNGINFISFSESDGNINYRGTQYSTDTTIFSNRQIKDQTGSNTAAIINIIGSSSSDGGEIPGNIELNYASHGVKVTNTNILNFGGQVINEGEVIFQTASGTRQLDYKTNSSGYYCLFVS